ncbi:hypothetical protein [Hymenobacter sp. GOD-10R]|uniref:hypothetical protein n=1 Tax=Hymenobacter sp. GOD-10R TaxID=3093922 RepID=UPI002D7A2D84|nr:hypothetical protein [Hymenobacter sp. GOD-10R]WRQ27244.1 hypothetical protein SD425_19415 [Hymenobacter sp. GOD-10R]
MKHALLTILSGFSTLLLTTQCATTTEAEKPSLEARRALLSEKPEPRVRDSVGVDTTGASATAPDAKVSATQRP